MTTSNNILLNAQQDGLISAVSLDVLLKTAPERIRIINASYPPDPRAPQIPSAILFDIDQIADPQSSLPHMLPDAETFGRLVGALGIGNDDFVIAYDNSGIAMAASRAWWMFKTFGHDRVAVLNAGLPAWIDQGYEVTPHAQAPLPTKEFNASFRSGWVTNLDEMRQITDQQSAIILDARPAARFQGLMPEPRPGMQPGHMPGARNLPFPLLLDPTTGELKAKEELRKILYAIDTNTDSRIVTTCGSGVTACVITLALFSSGYKNLSVYDGSWSEWGQAALNTPIVKDNRS